MNKRIKELIKQASVYASEFARGGNYSEHNPYNQAIYKTRYDEKFAELIVKECADLVDNTDDSRPHATFGLKIKEHFGVEE